MLEGGVIKAVKPKQSEKTKRERDVLLGLIETYLENGKPVGSGTLKDSNFGHLSSATIRNYFAKLEEEGYLHQQHTSGGRIPTEKAFRLYATEFSDQGVIESKTLEQIEAISRLETKEISRIIRLSVEELSRITGMAAFLSAPRFDQDFVIDIKVLPIDHHRTLFVLVTDFGSIQTEVLETDHKLSSFTAKRIEAYLHYRLTGKSKPEGLEQEEEQLAQKFYNEVVVRFLVGYTNFNDEDVLRTGYSRMLNHTEFRDPTALAESLSLFENSTSLRHLLRDTIAHKSLRYWIGTDLTPFGSKSNETAILTIPYMINSQYVGAFGVIGPLRMPYRQLFGALKAMSLALSNALTKNLYKFKITFRQPERFQLMIPDPKLPLIEHKPIKLIEHRKRT